MKALQRHSRLIWPALVFVLAACGGPPPDTTTDATVTYNVDTGRISVSGISAGAYMAGQFHVAHSALISGAGLVAGGPYRCASGSIKQGLGPCMNGGDLGVPALLEYAATAEADGSIDVLDNLADDRVWLFRGSKDAVMHADVAAAAAEFYGEFLPAGQIVAVNDVEVVHGFPTLTEGVACDEMATPFLNACGYDLAGELLAQVAGIDGSRGTAAGELRRVPQPGADDAEMLDEAFLYVPPACAAGEACGMHIVFHGCQQSSEFVGEQFAQGAGYNEWADDARLLILYPQVGSSKIAPLNPLGCWDWWGYTDENYATKDGAQLKVVRSTIDVLAGSAL